MSRMEPRRCGDSRSDSRRQATNKSIIRIKEQELLRVDQTFTNKYIYVVRREDRINQYKFKCYYKRLALSDRHYYNVITQTQNTTHPACYFDCFQLLMGDCIDIMTKIAHEMYTTRCYSDTKIYRPYSMTMAMQDLQALQFGFRHLKLNYVIYVGQQIHNHKNRMEPTNMVTTDSFQPINEKTPSKRCNKINIQE